MSYSSLNSKRGYIVGHIRGYYVGKEGENSQLGW